MTPLDPPKCLSPSTLRAALQPFYRTVVTAFNARVLGELKLRGETFYVRGREGLFVRNDLQAKRTPVILLPQDVLRALPIASDWDEVADAAMRTEEIRNRVNQHVGHIWAEKSKRQKAELKAEALSSHAAFQALLDSLHKAPPTAYDARRDPEGLLAWLTAGQEVSAKFPLDLPKPEDPFNLEDVHALVGKIIGQFRHLVEQRGLNHELYRSSGQPRKEATVQRLFFAVAYSYCKANDVDISPELDTGTGRIDFKFSTGFNRRVLVEVKLSTNAKLVAGHEIQLEAYRMSEETQRAFYLVIDVGRMGRKLKRLEVLRNAARNKGRLLPDLEIVDGTVRPSASKR